MSDRPKDRVRLFLAGDAMLGRGIDQVLRHPGDPRLFEAAAQSALDYVRLAGREGGAPPRGAGDAYVWGDLPGDLDRIGCDLRIINLETAITARGRPAAKGIHYRMHPANAGALRAARIDACALANNHLRDWGAEGLGDTLDALDGLGIGHAGAGRDRAEAEAPLVLPLPGAGRGRVILLSAADPGSGVPPGWSAGPGHPGVWRLGPDPDAEVDRAARLLAPLRRPGDIAVFSVHWGGNWGQEIPGWQRRFAHGLIERAGIDLVHGHSSHHPKAVEIRRGRAILYGCGDLVNDYEGIRPHDARSHALALGFVADLDPSSGRLLGLRMLPYRIRAFRLWHAGPDETERLRALMDEACARFGGRVVLAPDGSLELLEASGAGPRAGVPGG